LAGNPRIDELRKKLDKEPGSRLFAQLAEELRKDGDLEEAIQVAREGLQKHSNYPSARMTLGRALFDTGDWSAARAEFDLVLKGAPDNILASRLLAECLESLGDVPAAIARYKKTLALAPGDKQVLARLESLEKAGGTGAAAVTAGASAPSGSTGRPPEAAPAASPAPIRVVEVDTPMELEQAHERVTSFSSEAAASAPGLAEPAASPPPPPSASPAPIPVSAADEEFELERPYEPPRPVETSPPPGPATTAAPPSPAPPRPVAEGMMEFEFETGPTGSTIPFAPPPAPAPPVAEPESAPPAVSAPPPPPPPPPPEPVRAVEPPPPPAAPAAPPSAAFVPEPEREPDPSPAAARTVEVPWSAPPPKRMAPPPSREIAAPAPAWTPVPEPVPAPTAAAAPAPEPAQESAAGELMSATLAELYFNQGFVEKAVEVYRQLVDREPDNDRLRRRLDELQHPRPAPAPPAAEPALAVAPAAAASPGPDPASRRMALERTIARLEGMLAAIKKG